MYVCMYVCMYACIYINVEKYTFHSALISFFGTYRKHGSSWARTPISLLKKHLPLDFFIVILP